MPWTTSRQTLLLRSAASPDVGYSIREVRELIQRLLADPMALLLTAVAAFAVRHYWLGLRTHRWTRTTGRMLSSHLDVTLGRGGTPRNSPHVEYEYHVGDCTYRSTRIGYHAAMGPDDGRTRLDMLVAQSPLVVYYDPRKPARSVLVQGAGPRELAVVMLSVTLAGMFVFLALG